MFFIKLMFKSYLKEYVIYFIEWNSIEIKLIQ